MTLYGTFEFTVLAGALGLAAHHTLTRVMPLRRGLATLARVLGGAAGSAGLQRLGERIDPPRRAGGCGSGCGSCGSGCAPVRHHVEIAVKR